MTEKPHARNQPQENHASYNVQLTRPIKLYTSCIAGKLLSGGPENLHLLGEHLLKRRAFNLGAPSSGQATKCQSNLQNYAPRRLRPKLRPSLAKVAPEYIGLCVIA